MALSGESSSNFRREFLPISELEAVDSGVESSTPPGVCDLTACIPRNIPSSAGEELSLQSSIEADLADRDSPPNLLSRSSTRLLGRRFSRRSSSVGSDGFSPSNTCRRTSSFFRGILSRSSSQSQIQMEGIELWKQEIGKVVSENRLHVDMAVSRVEKFYANDSQRLEQELHALHYLLCNALDVDLQDKSFISQMNEWAVRECKEIQAAHDLATLNGADQNFPSGVAHFVQDCLSKLCLRESQFSMSGQMLALQLASLSEIGGYLSESHQYHIKSTLTQMGCPEFSVAVAFSYIPLTEDVQDMVKADLLLPRDWVVRDHDALRAAFFALFHADRGVHVESPGVSAGAYFIKSMHPADAFKMIINALASTKPISKRGFLQNAKVTSSHPLYKRIESNFSQLAWLSEAEMHETHLASKGLPREGIQQLNAICRNHFNLALCAEVQRQMSHSLSEYDQKIQDFQIKRAEQFQFNLSNTPMNFTDEVLKLWVGQTIESTDIYFALVEAGLTPFEAYQISDEYEGNNTVTIVDLVSDVSKRGSLTLSGAKVRENFLTEPVSGRILQRLLIRSQVAHGEYKIQAPIDGLTAVGVSKPHDPQKVLREVQKAAAAAKNGSRYVRAILQQNMKSPISVNMLVYEGSVSTVKPSDLADLEGTALLTGARQKIGAEGQMRALLSPYLSDKSQISYKSSEVAIKEVVSEFSQVLELAGLNGYMSYKLDSGKIMTYENFESAVRDFFQGKNINDGVQREILYALKKRLASPLEKAVVEFQQISPLAIMKKILPAISSSAGGKLQHEVSYGKAFWSHFESSFCKLKPHDINFIQIMKELECEPLSSSEIHQLEKSCNSERLPPYGIAKHLYSILAMRGGAVPSHLEIERQICIERTLPQNIYIGDAAVTSYQSNGGISGRYCFHYNIGSRSYVFGMQMDNDFIQISESLPSELHFYL